MCDVAYVMQLEALERQVLSDRLVLAALIANGRAEPDEGFPSIADVRASFDEVLCADPTELSPAEQLLRELGVR